MEITSDPRVSEVFNKYPDSVKPKLQYMRELILNTASHVNSLDEIEETLKWGEPSYLTKNGSTVRIDWKEKQPNQVAFYFKCTSKLLPTFKEIYPNLFQFEGNRAIVFKLDETIPEEQIKQCILLALTYHKVKHLPQLGAKSKD